MAGLVLTERRLRGGIWEGVLTAPAGAPPEVIVTHQDRPLSAELHPVEGRPGDWLLRVAVPAELLSEGVQTFLIAEAKSGLRLGSFAIIAGEAAGDDLRAEIDLLRAELELLKHAFRRHCARMAGAG